MSRAFQPRPLMIEEGHRATTFEIFFDLVFVFALIRITEFMAQAPSPRALAQGLLLILWFWYAWTCYAWLGNRARADVGLIRAGMTVAMAAIFVAALVIPEVWRGGDRPRGAPLTLALAYIMVRALHLALYRYSAANDRLTRGQVRRLAGPTALAWVPLILGSVLGGTWQALLWGVAFIVDYGGGRIAASKGLGEVHSAGHFAERHSLVLIIALGESLVSVGAGAGSAVTHWPVTVAALLGFLAAVCLWWLYFADAAPAAGRQLAQSQGERRQRIAADAYALAHLPLIAGIIYLALGIHEVVAHVAHDGSGSACGASLGWTSTTALYCGTATFLVGRLLFVRFTVGSTPPAQLIAIGAVLVLLPAGRGVPAVAALGIVSGLLIVLACYERVSPARVG